jgi:peroxiredoxin
LRRDYEEFKKRGAEIVVITQGNEKQTEEFCRDRRLPFPCLADPERRAFAAYSLGRGSLNQVLGPKVLLRGIQAALSGHGMGKPIGDAYQMPGVFIVDQSGTIRFIHRYRDSSDNPPNEVLLSHIPPKS